MFHCILLCTPANLTFIRDFFWKHSDICEGLIAPFTIFISCWCLTFHVHLFPGVNEFTLYLVSVSDMFSFIFFFFCFVSISYIKAGHFILCTLTPKKTIIREYVSFQNFLRHVLQIRRLIVIRFLCSTHSSFILI